LEIRIATRKSELALWQARHVAQKLELLPEVTDVTLVPLSTRGDEILDKSLQKIGSMKDVPAVMPEGFCIAAVLERANPHDAFLSADGTLFPDLPPGARIGSSSLRRQAQLKTRRPDIEVMPLRGNVNTRLKKLADGHYDAIILACAGLERLGLDSHITSEFDVEVMLPAAAQGVVGIECLESRDDLRQILALLEDPASKCTTVAERAVAATLDANCQSPVASFAVIENGTLTIDALVASPDGSKVIRERISGPMDDAENLGFMVAKQLLEEGAGELLAEENR
jgi:hydroxymethylbilane synthase